jgi:uncharacterized protein with NAD-binding domain and iron-sulfur cluster
VTGPVPPKVLVIGGGMAGLSAAWRLSEPGWQQRFSSITVVEASSRLGGKGASSRGIHGRTEEHGLHVWLGHYDNAFRVIRECYHELDREHSDPGCPIRTWTDAFLPADELGLFDEGEAGWLPWVAKFSGNRSLPGGPEVDDAPPTVAELLLRSALLVRDFYRSLPLESPSEPTLTLSTSPFPPRSRNTVRGALTATLVAASQQLLHLGSHGAQRLAGPSGGAAIDAAFRPLLRALGPALTADAAASRLHDLVDLVRTVLVGMAVDGLRGDRDAYDAINHLDFREWLTRHGAQPSTLRSAIVRGQYDLVFSHEDGDPSRPRFAAGWGAFLSAKLWFEYKGAIFWKMRAGMGDVVFVPLYQALLGRGVEFALGQRVDDVVPTGDRSAIASIVMTEQVPIDRIVRAPLSTVNGVPYFPDVAVVGDGPRRQLRQGDDFDVLVLAIPPAAARRPCSRLAGQRREWRLMFDRIRSVATHAFQVWLTDDERALGWPYPGTTMSAFAKPFDTWASMSHLVDLEAWPEHIRPSTIAYFCSTREGSGTESPAMAADETRRLAISFLDRDSRHFWPRAVDPATNAFNWDLLCGEGNERGPARFDSQYWTANTAPSDLYVQSLPDTDQYRLRPDRSGYVNLAIAGDWTDSGINAGCIEAAAVSGLQAANFLLGRPRWDRISGVFLH